MKVSIFLMSFGATYCAGSNPFTSPAIRVGNALASKCVIGPMPLLPATTFFHVVATSLPTGETMPIPVTTTRRLLMGTPHSRKSMQDHATDATASPDASLSAQGLSIHTPPHSRGAQQSESCAREAQLSGYRRTLHCAAQGHARPSSGLDVRLDVIDRLLDGGDLLGFLVRNFGFEFLFECHHQFDRIQRVRAQVVDERGVWRDVLFLDSQLIDHDLLDALFDAAHETVPPGTNDVRGRTKPFPTTPRLPIRFTR